MSMSLRNTSVKRALRIGQLNVQGFAVCVSKLHRIVADHCLDIMMIQEPYSRHGKIPYVEGVRVYYVEGRPQAAIYVYNSDIELVFLPEIYTRHHVSIRIFYGDEELAMVSSYFKYRDPIYDYIATWLLCARRGK